MKTQKTFSYEEYREIIKAIKQSNKVENFYTAVNKTEYVIMRHDVEFSVEDAYHLAEVEQKEEFYSTFLFQLTNNTYNLLSDKNINLVNQIHDMGHCIGFHYHMNNQHRKSLTSQDIEQIKQDIISQINLLNLVFNFKVDIFSIHRPTPDILRANIKFNHLINTYQDEYFTFVEDIEKEIPKIRYISDARHRWNYGLYPDNKTIREKDKVQILLHPYSWSKQGYDNLNNFRRLVREKKEEYLNSIEQECSHFTEIKDQLGG